jgi:integrase/recombinase XerD
MTASGIYHIIARRGRQCGMEVSPHRFRHHFSHTWLARGGAEGDLMELKGWTSPADAPPLRHQRPQRRCRRERRPALRTLTGSHVGS